MGTCGFTDNEALGRITTAGVITEFPTSEYLTGLTVGGDRNLWASSGPNGVVGVFATTGAQVASYPLAGYPGVSMFSPDGNVWICDGETSQVSRVTPQGVSSTLSFDILHDSDTSQSTIGEIVTGPDNDLWYPEEVMGFNPRFAIGHVGLNGGTPTRFPFSSATATKPYVYFGGMAWDSQKNLWVVATASAHYEGPQGVSTHVSTLSVLRPQSVVVNDPSNVRVLYRMTLSGTITSWTWSGSQGVVGLVIDPSQNLWFADNSGHIERESSARDDPSHQKSGSSRRSDDDSTPPTTQRRKRERTLTTHTATQILMLPSTMRMALMIAL